MGVYDSVEFNSESNVDYCPKFLYRFSFWIVILGWVFVALALVSLD